MRAQTAAVSPQPYHPPPKYQSAGLSSYALPEDTGSVGSPLKLVTVANNAEQSSYLSVDDEAKKHILVRQGLNKLVKKRKMDRMLLQIASGQKIDNPYVVSPDMNEEKLEILRLATFTKNFSTSASKIHGSHGDNVWNNPMWRDSKRCKFINPKHGIEFQEHMLKKQLQKEQSNLDIQAFNKTSSTSFGVTRNNFDLQQSGKSSYDLDSAPVTKHYRLQSFFTKAKEAENLFKAGSSEGYNRPSQTELGASEVSLLKHEKAIQLQDNYLDRPAKSDMAYLELAVDSKTKGEAKGSSNTIPLDVSSNSGFTHPNKQVKFAHKRIKSQPEFKDNPKLTFQMLCDVSDQEMNVAREPHLLLYESLRHGKYPAFSKGVRTSQGSATNLKDTQSVFRRSSNGAVFRTTTQSGCFAGGATKNPSRSVPSSPPRTSTKPSTANLKLTTSASFFPRVAPRTGSQAPTVASGPSLHSLSRAAYPPTPVKPTLHRMEEHLATTMTNNSFHPLDFAAVESRKDLRDLYTRSPVVRQYFEAKLQTRLQNYPTPKVGALPRPDIELQKLWAERQRLALEVPESADDLNRPAVFREEVDRLDWEREVREVLGGGIETVSMTLEKQSRNLRNGERLQQLAAASQQQSKYTRGG